MTASPARILLVGGAGYIGAICARTLAEAGHTVAAYDDLSTGHRAAVTGHLYTGDILDRAALRAALAHFRPDAVLHFAAKALVGESVRAPLSYFDTNTAGTIALLQELAHAGVRRLVFSSTCAVYGDPRYLPLDEDHPHAPVNPYGESKAIVEQILAACRAREGFGATALRYFNAAGAMPDGSLGEAHSPETHLIPLALQAALGQRPPLQLFGDDYPTRDGTCIRDYVHVCDLADAHRRAVERLLEGDPGDAYNLGTGQGTTVRELLAAVEAVLGRPVPHAVAPRRDGDPPALYAVAARARQALGWEPRYTDIQEIVRTAAVWASAPRYGSGVSR